MTIGRSVHRFRMNGVIAPIGVTATVLASLAVGLPAAQASDGADQRGTDPVLGSWAWSSFTDGRRTANPPADPDLQDGEENPLNLVKIGEVGRFLHEQDVGRKSGQPWPPIGCRPCLPGGDGWQGRRLTSGGPGLPRSDEPTGHSPRPVTAGSR